MACVCVEKTPPVMTLYGNDYLAYNLSTKADTIVSNSDSTSLYFKTGQPDAHLFYTGTLVFDGSPSYVIVTAVSASLIYSERFEVR